jgi:hypothetical protein
MRVAMLLWQLHDLSSDEAAVEAKQKARPLSADEASETGSPRRGSERSAPMAGPRSGGGGVEWSGVMEGAVAAAAPWGHSAPAPLPRSRATPRLPRPAVRRRRWRTGATRLGPGFLHQHLTLTSPLSARTPLALDCRAQPASVVLITAHFRALIHTSTLLTLPRLLRFHLAALSHA